VRALRTAARRRSRPGARSSRPTGCSPASNERDCHELEEIHRALGKIAGGSYGHCEGGGEPIGPARIEVIPEARCCLVCAAEREQARRLPDAAGKPSARPLPTGTSTMGARGGGSRRHSPRCILRATRASLGGATYGGRFGLALRSTSPRVSELLCFRERGGITLSSIEDRDRSARGALKLA